MKYEIPFSAWDYNLQAGTYVSIRLSELFALLWKFIEMSILHFCELKGIA